MICLIMGEGGSGDAIAIAAGDLKKMKVVDGIVKEPAVGAHRSPTKPLRWLAKPSTKRCRPSYRSARKI